MAIITDCRQPRNKLMMGDPKIIHKLSTGEVPHKQWKWLLGLIATHTDPAISTH